MRVMLTRKLLAQFSLAMAVCHLPMTRFRKPTFRPIWTDADLYTIKAKVSVAANATDDAKAKAFIRAAVKSRKDYKGSGNPVLFTTEDVPH